MLRIAGLAADVFPRHRGKLIQFFDCGSRAMKCSELKFATVSVLFAVLLSSSTEASTRATPIRSSYLRCRSDRQTAMHKNLSCSLSRLSSAEPVAIVRMSGCLRGLHPIRLYWFRTRMTDCPF